MAKAVSVSDDKVRTGRPIFRWIGPACSILLLVAVSACLSIQPDSLATGVLVPAWCWLIVGLVLASFGFRRDGKRWTIAVLVFWTVFTCLFVEESFSLLRSRSLSTTQWQTLRETGRGLRVVSLNCNVGQVKSVEEVAAYEADIVLLQESPGREQLQMLVQSLFGSEGSFLYGGDVSILARGKLGPKFSDTGSHFIHREVELSSGFLIDVVCTRLAPPVPRFDFWSAGFWSDHRNKRVEHRAQVLEIVQHLQHLSPERHVILGGDFNAPSNDDALASLRFRMSDSFVKAGTGWGATGTNEYPLFRVDQIWASSRLQPALVTAQKTQHSDHRMVSGSLGCRIVS